VSIVSAKIYYYYMNLLFLYVCTLFSYILAYTFRLYVLTIWAYVPCMGVQRDCSRILGECVLMSVVEFM
jgi:hypothetical protein